MTHQKNKTFSKNEATISPDEFPLSFDQQAQWFSQQKNDGTTSAYNLAISQRICSPLNINALRESFQLIIERHSLLRAVFTMKEGQLVQKIKENQKISFKVIDASKWNEEQLKQEVIQADEAPFDLASGPLFRVHLFQCGQHDYVLLITIHHIIFDGWSGAIVMHELDKIYPKIASAKTPNLPELKFTYKDYIQWYTELLATPKGNRQKNYWHKKLSGELPVLKLPTDYPRPSLPAHHGAINFFQLDVELVQELKKLAKDEGVTLFSLLLATFNVFLHNYTGQEDIIVGSPIANRNNYKFINLVGDLVNMVALRNNCSKQLDFSSFLTQVHHTVKETLKYPEYPFQLLVKELQPKRVLGYSPIFQTVFVLQKPIFENSPWQTMDPTVETFDWAGLKTKSFIIPTAAGRFDLLLEMVELKNTIVSWFNYNTDLFNADTINQMVEHFKTLLQNIVQNSKQKIQNFSPRINNEHSPKQEEIAISATFTAEPLEDSLNFWMQKLAIPAKVAFAPYNQVFQQLLDPASLLANNKQGVNLILVRFEDWIKDKETNHSDIIVTIKKNRQDLANYLKNSVKNTAVSYFICICPASPNMASYADFFKQMEETLDEEIKNTNSLYLLKSSELLNSYPVDEFYDPYSDKEGHIPYTYTFFTALGTLLSRKMYVLKQKNLYKVIVLDCDNTIWQGVCGEEGALGVKISAPYQALQTFMLKKQSMGFLLCLCSKNSEEDVFAVFEQRSDMPIKREHLVSWRINWQAKSENIKSLAQELQLGLNSFIFIDDNPVECAEVQANCPEVLTLQLPTKIDTIPSFIENIWAFDILKTTTEDQQRTTFYQQNVQREQLRQQTMTLESFLDSLNIQVQMTEMQAAQINRVSQMTQRTNQFNASTIRRTETEIQQLVQSDKYTCLVIDVKDKFGDYGLVGLVIFTVDNDTLKTDTFLLSCRVLGRGVEHQILARLGKIAEQRKLDWVEIDYKSSPKNEPIKNFLNSIDGNELLAEGLFKFSVTLCKTVIYSPDSNKKTTTSTTTSSSPTTVNVIQANSTLLQHIATQLSNPKKLLHQLESEKHSVLKRQQPIVSPRTKTETKLAELWKKVLHIESVSIHDNFFEFGGDSLLAVKLMFYVQKDFRMELPLSQLLNAPTVAGLSQVIEKQDGLKDKNTPSVAVVIRKNTISKEQNTYPLAYGQRALWFLYQSDRESAAYNVALPLRIRSKINLQVLQGAFQTLVNRHPCLRTTFSSNADGEPLQTVHQYQIIPFEWTDTTTWSAEKIQAQVLEYYKKPFDLDKGPLLRVNVFSSSQQEHIILLTIHHIVVDGWSLWQLVEELGKLYSPLQINQPSILPPLEYNYVDFVDWQSSLLKSKEELLWRYWKEQLAGELPILNLPTDYPRPKQPSYQGASVHFVIANPLMADLKQLAQNEKVSLYTLLLAAYQVLLYRYTGQEDILVGSPTTGRTKNEFAAIVGYFVNMLVLRTKIQENSSFKDFLSQVQQTVISALEHQDYPFMLLVERIQPQRDVSRSPLFQVDFAFQQLQQNDNLEFFSSNKTKLGMKAGELELETFEMGQQEGLFDLTLDIIEIKDSLIATFMYSTELFEESTIIRMTEHFQVLLEGITTNASQLISALPLLKETEKTQLLYGWNNTQIEYFDTKNECIHQLFETQVTKTPEAIAIVFGEQTLSYKQLNKKANQLADYLRIQAIKPETVVGICVERSLEMVIGLLGILKAGGAYLPLDPLHPTERIAFMLKDANVSVLLTQAHLASQYSLLDLSVVSLDKYGVFSPLNSNNPVNDINGENTAYIIYTSGSTGAPKGVILKHDGLVNHNLAIIQQYQLTADDRCLQFANLNFDVATEEIFPTLLTGATLVISPVEGFSSLVDFQEFIDHKQLTTLNIPASYWHEWVLHLSTIKKIPSNLRLIVVGSEKVSLESLRIWQALDKHQVVKWFNAYGPTEATITATIFQTSCLAQLAERNISSVPIGKPIANTQAYVLDRNLQLTPIGVVGELHLGGAGIAVGYLNNPDLTAEKFISNPFGASHKYRLYKTGDLVRYLPNGNIEYLERIDHQVKIRGFRIEIGEIEATLMRHSNVQDTLVNVSENQSNKYLVAYVVPKNSTFSDESKWQLELTNYLKEKLPDYMVPKTVMILDAFPLTPNGKIDRKALPAPDIRKNINYTAPRSETERYLARVWSEVLGYESIGIQDNFFELGGDSIRSLQIVAKAKEYDLFIKTNDIFQNQTIAELATVVQKDKVISVDQGTVLGKSPLLPIQEAFFARKLPQPWHYNQFVLLDANSELNTEWLRQAFVSLFLHHDSLRFFYHLEANKWQQTYNSPTNNVPFFIEDLTDTPEEEQQQLFIEKAAYYQTSFDLTKGNLSCLIVFKLSDGIRLLWCIHHLLVDGISWRILLDDLQLSYQQISQKKSIKLPQKTTSFKDWVENLHNYAKSETFSEQMVYWKSTAFQDFSLAVDYPDAINSIDSTQEYIIGLNPTETNTLLKETSSAYNTSINDLLLTALTQTITAWNGQETCVIDLESHGRVDLFEHLDVSRTVGWFTTIYPVKLHLPVSHSLGDDIEAVKKQLHSVPNEGIAYGLQHYFKQKTTLSEPGKILFNYLGQFDQYKETAIFHPTTEEESFGLSQSKQGNRDYLLEINGLVDNDGCLIFNWSYSANLYNQATIQNLADNFLRDLKKISIHCKNVKLSTHLNPASLLVPIRAEGSQRPFFCIPGMQGVSRYLYPLAHQLSHEQPFYGLNAPEIVEQTSCDSIETLAERYIAAIKTVQAHGPYQIGGHSFGAVVAFEMALQLEQANEVVSSLILVDEPVPDENKVIVKKNEYQELVDYLKWLAFFNNIDNYDGNLKPYTQNKRIELALDYLNQAGLALDLQEFKTTLQAFVNNDKCYNKYVLKGKLSSKIVLLQSLEQNVNLGWQQYTAQKIEVHKVLGNHFSMLALPHVKTLSNILSNIF